ncbi:MAG: hypothetical protein V4689_21905 [Verrucomicrobiota bacterium]
MKTTPSSSRPLIAGAVLLISIISADARSFGVSSSSAGRGTVYNTSRGGRAYVGPRGVAAQGADGRSAVATERGAAYAGPNGAAAAGRYGGAAAVTNNGAYYRPPAAALPSGYIRTVPTGYTAVVYGGYNCYYVGGIYYRAVMYQGSTVYVVVN